MFCGGCGAMQPPDETVSFFTLLEVPEERKHTLNPQRIQGYLAQKKPPPPWDHHRALGIALM